MTDHITFIVNSYPPRLGGLEMHVSNLAEELVKLGIRVSVFTVGSTPSVRTQNGVYVHTVRGFLNIGTVISFPRFGTSRKIKRHVQLTGVTAVSVHTRFFPMTWVGIFVAKSSKIASVLTEHGSGFVSSTSPIIALCSRIIDLTLGRYSLRRATRLLAISSSASDFVRRISGKDAVVFHNAIDTQFWSAALLPRKNNLVFIGRLVQGKGWFESIQCFNISAATNSEIQLHIFGDGPERGTVEKLRAQSPFSNRIVIHGRQPPVTIREQLRSAVYLNPTTLSEGFQTTLLESAAAGARIVSYTTPGLEDLRNSGALVFEANSVDELSQKLTEALRVVPRTLNNHELSQWDWKTRAQEYCSIIRALKS